MIYSCAVCAADYHDIWIMRAHLAFYYIIRHLLMCLQNQPYALSQRFRKTTITTITTTTRASCALVMKLNCGSLSAPLPFICLHYYILIHSSHFAVVCHAHCLSFSSLFFFFFAVALKNWVKVASNYHMKKFFIVAPIKKLATLLT